jgi:hypothetical protein
MLSFSSLVASAAVFGSRMGFEVLDAGGFVVYWTVWRRPLGGAARWEEDMVVFTRQGGIRDGCKDDE